MFQVGKEVGEQVLGQDADVAFHMIVQDESGGYGGLVLPASSLALAAGQVDRFQRSHDCE